MTEQEIEAFFKDTENETKYWSKKLKAKVFEQCQKRHVCAKMCIGMVTVINLAIDEEAEKAPNCDDCDECHVDHEPMRDESRD